MVNKHSLSGSTLNSLSCFGSENNFLSDDSGECPVEKIFGKNIKTTYIKILKNKVPSDVPSHKPSLSVFPKPETTAISLRCSQFLLKQIYAF